MDLTQVEFRITSKGKVEELEKKVEEVKELIEFVKKLPLLIPNSVLIFGDKNYLYIEPCSNQELINEVQTDHNEPSHINLDYISGLSYRFKYNGSYIEIRKFNKEYELNKKISDLEQRLK
jgi:uncharacterized protein YaaN involved in tellurite resistance